MSLPSLDDGDDSVYDVENEILCELSGFVLDSEFWCHESHGETFCSADPQVEGRSVLWTWVYSDIVNVPISSEQQLRDRGMVNPGCDGELTVEGSYLYTATDSTRSLSGCQVDIFHGGVVEYTDVSIDGKLVSIAIEANQSLFQSYSSGMLNASCGTKFDHSVRAVEYGMDAGSEYRKVVALFNVVSFVSEGTPFSSF